MACDIMVFFFTKFTSSLGWCTKNLQSKTIHRVNDKLDTHSINISSSVETEVARLGQESLDPIELSPFSLWCIVKLISN